MKDLTEYQIAEREVDAFTKASSRIINGVLTFDFNHMRFRILSCHRRIQPAHRSIPEHEHPNYEISFMRTGSMVTTCDAHRIAASPAANRILFMPPLTFHSRLFGPETCNINETMMVVINGADNHGEHLCSILPALISRRRWSFAFSPALMDLSRLFAEYLECEAASEIALTLLKAWMGIFLSDNFPELFDPVQLKKSFEHQELKWSGDRIGAIKNAVENNFAINESLRKCESQLGLSLRHLNRIFKAETGETLNQYLIRRKLEAAENLLISSRTSIGEISSVLGFSSQEQFAVFFRRHRHCTPSEFRCQEHSTHDYLR